MIEAHGDGSLAVFPTALDAVNCALVIQQVLAGSDSARWRPRFATSRPSSRGSE